MRDTKIKSRKQRPGQTVSTRGYFHKIITIILALMLTLGFAPGVMAEGDADYGENTAYITSKTAEWIDPENWLAQLTLTVNGTQILEPLDVVIVLDRSGSMDMTWPGNRITQQYRLWYGYPAASCPCLNQGHFYLPPVVRQIDGLEKDKEYCLFRSFDSPYGGQNITIKYYEKSDGVKYNDGNPYEGWGANSIPHHVIGWGLLEQPGDRQVGVADLAVITGYGDYVPSNNLGELAFKEASTGAIVYYDPDEDQWYEYGYAVDAPGDGTEKNIGHDNEDGTLTVYKEDYGIWTLVDATKPTNLYYQFEEDSYQYIPYHFKRDGEKYKLISQWDTKEWDGIWKHADQGSGCYDRWMEAKDAISSFTAQLLDAHEENNVALVPFSIRDSAVVGDMNGRAALRDWIIHKNGSAFGAETGVTVDAENKLSGEYQSWINWTNDVDKIDDMLPRLFTTGNTDYVYGLSMAYNLLYERSPKAKEEKHAVVLFISDGVPYSSNVTIFVAGDSTSIAAFYNSDTYIYALADAIIGDVPVTAPKDFWTAISGRYQRHDIKPAYLMEDNVGAYGLGAQLVTVGYMIEEKTKGDEARLKDMASDPESYIKIPATTKSSMDGYLTEQLLSNSLFPGGRESVLYDTISQYYYVPDDWDNPYDNVTILGSQDEPQTVVWEIGKIYAYAQDSQPSITVPLVLREEYRVVETTTYYPTNDYVADEDPDPELYKPENGPDGGAKLTYKDPKDRNREHTITTPKLPVLPESISPIRVPLNASKSSNGSMAAEQFIFTLYLSDELGTQGDVVGTATNKSAGTSSVITFADMAFDAPGEYYYLLRETAGGGSRWTLDEAHYLIKIEISKEEGSLVDKVEYARLSGEEWVAVEELTFRNTYTSPGGHTPDPSPKPDPTPEPEPEPTPEPEPEPAPDPEPTPEPEPPYIPGGKDRNVPPMPSVSGNTLEPTEDGRFVEISPGGVPLGEWVWEDDEEVWVFEEYVPLYNIPQTGDSDMLTWPIIMLALSLSGIVILTVFKPDKRRRYQR